jgi:excisionase family DNA binding protein
MDNREARRDVPLRGKVGQDRASPGPLRQEGPAQSAPVPIAEVAESIMAKRRSKLLPKAQDERSLLTIAQVCTILNCSRPTIYKLKREGRLVLVPFGTGRTRITSVSLNRYLDELMSLAE